MSSRRSWHLTALFSASALGLLNCAMLSATSPTIAVADIRLTGIGLLEQSVLLTLCVTNPNHTELDFERVHFVLNVSGSAIARGTSEIPTRLPPTASTMVPIAITTTDRNLRSQILSTLQTGSIAFSLDGRVTLACVPFPISFNKAGDLSLLSAGLQLAAVDQSPAATPCQLSLSQATRSPTSQGEQRRS